MSKLKRYSCKVVKSVLLKVYVSAESEEEAIDRIHLEDWDHEQEMDEGTYEQVSCVEED